MYKFRHLIIMLYGFTFILLFQTVVTAGTGINDFESLCQALIKDGFEADKINAVYNDPTVKFAPESVSLFFRHTEAKINYDQYVSDQSLKKAKEYITKYQKELVGVEKKFGVEKEIIAAIILVETQFGKLIGRHQVLSTLSTMAALSGESARNRLWEGISESEKPDKKAFENWADRRAKWSYAELKALLEYTFRENMNPAEIYGSYAGALGIAQFMPTSIIAYGKDGDNDDRIDLMNHADAMASIANFLKRFGWKPGITKEKASEVLYRYNHSGAYVETLLNISEKLKG